MAAESIQRAASVQWRGDFSRGRGEISADSGRLEAQYSFETRFSGAPGTNPEELVGAALASCFTMAFALVLGRANAHVDLIHTRVGVTLEQLDSGYEITSMQIKTVATVGGVSGEEFQKLAQEAHATCPLGKALRAVPVTLEAIQTSAESNEASPAP